MIQKLFRIIALPLLAFAIVGLHASTAEAYYHSSYYYAPTYYGAGCECGTQNIVYGLLDSIFGNTSYYPAYSSYGYGNSYDYGNQYYSYAPTYYQPSYYDDYSAQNDYFMNDPCGCDSYSGY